MSMVDYIMQRVTSRHKSHVASSILNHLIAFLPHTKYVRMSWKWIHGFHPINMIFQFELQRHSTKLRNFCQNECWEWPKIETTPTHEQTHEAHFENVALHRLWCWPLATRDCDRVCGGAVRADHKQHHTIIIIIIITYLKRNDFVNFQNKTKVSMKKQQKCCCSGQK